MTDLRILVSWLFNNPFAEDNAREFEKLDGAAAFKLKRSLAGLDPGVLFGSDKGGGLARATAMSFAELSLSNFVRRAEFASI